MKSKMSKSPACPRLSWHISLAVWTFFSASGGFGEHQAQNMFVVLVVIHLHEDLPLSHRFKQFWKGLNLKIHPRG